MPLVKKGQMYGGEDRWMEGARGTGWMKEAILPKSNTSQEDGNQENRGMTRRKA